MRSSPPVAPSPITTPSGVTTGPGTTPSAPSRSRRRCGPPRRPSTRRGSPIQGYSAIDERGGQELRGDHQGEGGPQPPVPVPAPHGAHEPVRDGAHAVG